MAEFSIQHLFELAARHHEAGRLKEAEELYRQILANNPNHADALYCLGAIAARNGRYGVAVELAARATAVNPNRPEAHNNLGTALKNNGQLDAAIAAYRRAITLRSDFPEAHSNLGNALHDNAQLDEAICSYHRAILLRPNFPEAYYNLAITLNGKQKADAAIAAFRRAITLRPNFPEAYVNLAAALRATGELDQAIGVYRGAIALKPDYVEAHYNLGVALNERGEIDAAIAAYREAIALAPSYAAAHYSLGAALVERGHVEEAMGAYRQAIAHRPDHAESHCNLGDALQKLGRPDEAMAACRQALALKGDFPEALSNLGNALRDKGQLDEAIAVYRRAIALAPDSPEPHSNLGVALRENRQVDEAITEYRRAIALRSDYPEAHRNLALALLTRGDFQQGWEEHEWRWECRDHTSPRRNFPQPLWDGHPLEGRTLLLHAEQGLGDTIHFIRYLPLAARRGGKIVVECQAELQRLLRTIAGERQIVCRGRPLPPFDLHCPLPSLPRIFKTGLESVPAEVPYLVPDPHVAELWRQRLTTFNGVKIGVAWAGNPNFRGDRTRSITLDHLAPVARVHGPTFFSLQKGNAACQADHPPTGQWLVNLAAGINDLADTAAAMSLMDLVITTDTSVAHLAGALGRPVWVLLQFAPDWRWLLDRADSPWYPTMRLFRQPRRGDWDSVTKRVVEELSVYLKTPRRSS